MEPRSPATLGDYRARYARSSNWTLLQIDPDGLTPEARQALAEEAARRGLTRQGKPAHARVRRPRLGEYIYPKAPLGERFLAYIVDSVIGMGPFITAAIYDFIFRIAQSPTNRTINMIATVTWMIYYGATKDARGEGQSIGKKLFGLMVVATDTNEPCTVADSFERAFVRVVLSGIPLVGQLIEPIAVLVNEDGRRIGDRAAGTQVIRASDYEGRGATDQSPLIRAR